MTVWRIHIRPGHPGVLNLCLDQGVFGVGYRIDWPQGEAPTPDRYLQLGEEQYRRTEYERGWRRTLPALINAVRRDDLIWTRDTRGLYYLGRVTDGWQYKDEPSNREVDIVNVRPGEIYRMGLEHEVPGKVIASFRPRATLQRIFEVEVYSKFLFIQLSNRHTYPVEPLDGVSIFSLLGYQDVEDVIYVYLQTQGYVVYPNRRKHDAIAFECSLRHKKDFQEAAAQVKTGDEQLHMPEYGLAGCRVYLFATNGIYTGDQPANVTTLSPPEIVDFMKEHARLLPGDTQRWMQICGLLQE